MDRLEAVTEGFEAGREEGVQRGMSSDCKRVVCRRERGGPTGGTSLIWGFVGFQKLLGECVDLVSASNFMGQQR